MNRKMPSRNQGFAARVAAFFLFLFLFMFPFLRQEQTLYSQLS